MLNECFHYNKKMLPASGVELARMSICFGSSGQAGLRRSRAIVLAFTYGQAFFSGGERVTQPSPPTNSSSPELTTYFALLRWTLDALKSSGAAGSFSNNAKAPAGEGLVPSPAKAGDPFSQ